MMAVPTTQADVDANPPTRPMPAFLANQLKANQNIICTAKGNDVRKASIADLLSQRLRIPIFQRRYCWGEDQWDTLLNDALIVADGHKEKHPLGRITCIKSAKDDGRLLVIDGQQRNTTCSLLLAAIRDIALQEHAGHPESEELVATLDRTLFPDSDGLRTWLAQSDESTILAEGAALEFAALVPTYCDRASYFAAILPPRAVAEVSAEWQRPSEAKSHFISKLTAFSFDSLLALADVVLYKLEWLFFPISVDGDHQDGTEDVQLIYERLAIRDATWCKPSRATEFASMGSADFVRNLLLGSFRRESDAIEMYKEHWLPIEQAAASASVRNRSGNIAEILESMLSDFLKAQPEKALASKSLQPGFSIGGELYPRFRKWLTAALAVDGIVALGEDEADMLERKTGALLQRLQAFAIEHLARSNASKQSVATVKPASAGYGLPRQLVSAKWRCSRCSFPNDASFSQCTACSLPRS